MSGPASIATGFTRDLRLCLRRLRREPGFSIVVVVSLALAIGANSAAFSFVDALFLHPFPALREPERLVAIFSRDEKADLSLPVSPSVYDYLQHNIHSFTGLCAYQVVKAGLDLGSEVLPRYGEVVSGNCFQTLGVRAVLGRTFLPAEADEAEPSPLVVLSYNLWQGALGGDPGVVGRLVKINGSSFTILGVAQPDFNGTSSVTPASFWVPLGMHRRFLDLSHFANLQNVQFLQLAGRIRPGLSLGQAAAELRTNGVALARLLPPEDRDQTLGLVPFTTTAISADRRPLFLRTGIVLYGLVAVLLLMSCINAGNLFLVRTLGRRHEMTVWLALGCGRLRLLGQLLLESAVLTTLACGLGLFIASWMRRMLWLYKPPYFTDDALILHADRRVLTFTILVSLLATVLFSLAPALEVFRAELMLALRDHGADKAGAEPRSLLRQSALVLQVALCLVCLYGAGLFLRTLQSSHEVDPGFDTARLLVANFDLSAAGYRQARAGAFEAQLLESMKRLPGIESASLSETRVLGGWTWSREVSRFGVAGAATDNLTVGSSHASPDYFRATGIRILAGRPFSEQDTRGGEPVAIINQTLARRLWPDGNAVGGFLKMDEEPQAVRVIGIARDSKYRSLGEPPQSFVYLPLSRQGVLKAALHVRAANPERLVAPLREEFRRMDTALPKPEVRTAAEIVERSLWAPRSGAVVLSIFGAVAVMIAAIGIFGMTAYSVSRHRFEIGLRLALGASRPAVVSLFLRRGMRLIAIGVAVGLSGSVLLSRAMAHLLPIAANDEWLSLGMAAALFTAIGFVANLLPATRAARLDPALPMRNAPS